MSDDDHEEEMFVDNNSEEEDIQALVDAEELPPEAIHFNDDAWACLTGHRQDVFQLALSSDGSKLLSGSEDDTAILWDLSNLGTSDIDRVTFTNHRDSVTCVNFNHNSTLFATADISGKIFIYDSQLKQPLYEIDHCDDIEWTLWHPSSDILFAGTAAGIIHMFLLSREQVERTKVFTTDTNAPCSVGKLMADGKSIIAAYADGKVALWDLKEGTYKSLVVTSPCTALEVHPSLNLVAVGLENGTVAMVNTTTMKIVTQLASDLTPNPEDPALNSVETIRFAPAPYPWLAVGCASGILILYDYETGQPRHHCNNEGVAVVKCYWYTPDSEKIRIISVSFDGGLRGWDAKTGDAVLFKDGGGVEAFDVVAASLGGESYIFTACGNGSIRIFKYSEEARSSDQQEDIALDRVIAKMSYQMYRSTTLGDALQQTLEEFVRDAQIPASLVPRVMAVFDKCINNALSTRLRNKTTFKAEKLRAYRFCDNVWTFLMNNVEFRDSLKPIEGTIDRVKVVACDASVQRRGT